MNQSTGAHSRFGRGRAGGVQRADWWDVAFVIGVAFAAVINSLVNDLIMPILAMILSTLFEGYRWSVLAAAGGTVAMVGLLIALSARKPVTKSG